MRTPASTRLPVAAGRNRGARRALRDRVRTSWCSSTSTASPAPACWRRYETAGDASRPGPALLAGPVAYLRRPAGGHRPADARRRPARTRPVRRPPRESRREPDMRLFWSLSFAVDRPRWARIGGFDEAYIGYGAEDTDFAQLATGCGAPVVGRRRDGVPPVAPGLRPAGRAPRRHRAQRQPVPRPWGWFPMEGWLHAFAARRTGSPRFQRHQVAHLAPRSLRTGLTMSRTHSLEPFGWESSRVHALRAMTTRWEGTVQQMRRGTQ